ncbi:hypothetical protein NPIL_465991 [Nephila pilipes]|uniref:Uncharacterized protein n=1 Tax=Nephila pilipes TaxID=299642 RepID=A0A8X6PKU4_NEPPI|nr:hypothetical protein NPIL_465991 [Nephila pilipes]
MFLKSLKRCSVTRALEVQSTVHRPRARKFLPKCVSYPKKMALPAAGETCRESRCTRNKDEPLSRRALFNFANKTAVKTADERWRGVGHAFPAIGRRLAVTLRRRPWNKGLPKVRGGLKQDPLTYYKITFF